MALQSSHVSTPVGTQSGTTCQGRYLTHHRYGGMGCTRERGRLVSLREQRETKKWKGDLYHKGHRDPQTKKDSTKRAAYTSKNDDGPTTSNKNWRLYA